MFKVLRELTEIKQPLKENLVTEGFMDFTVNGSDSAADLHAAALDAVEKHLRKGLKDKGNAYNTHGTLNVAMILIEKYKDELNEYGHFHDLAVDVLNKLNDEIKEQQKRDKENNRVSGDYLTAMQSFAKKLTSATKSKR